MLKCDRESCVNDDDDGSLDDDHHHHRMIIITTVVTVVFTMMTKGDAGHDDQRDSDDVTKTVEMMRIMQNWERTVRGKRRLIMLMSLTTQDTAKQMPWMKVKRQTRLFGTVGRKTEFATLQPLRLRKKRTLSTNWINKHPAKQNNKFRAYTSEALSSNHLTKGRSDQYIIQQSFGISNFGMSNFWFYQTMVNGPATIYLSIYLSNLYSATSR